MIKQSTLDGIRRYVEYHIPPGDFLQAVLQNNLKEAFFYADDENLASLYEIVKYVYNEIPYNCWGSPEAYRDWITPKVEPNPDENNLEEFL